MAGGADSLSPRQREAIRLLVAGASRERAAEGASVSSRTLRRWQQEESFVRAMEAAQAAALSAARSALRAAALDAVEALREVLRDQGAPAAARVTGARCVLDLALRAREQEEMEARIRALEVAADADTAGRAP